MNGVMRYENICHGILPNYGIYRKVDKEESKESWDSSLGIYKYR